MKRKEKTVAVLLAAACALGALGCGGEKEITVIARDAGSGTREAFDRVVTDGTHYLEEKKNGKKVYNTTLSANIQAKTAAVLSLIERDINAVSYASLGSVNERVKVVKVNGVTPSTESVLSGEYPIQRPFVIMTNSEVALTARTADFMQYLYSTEMQAHAEAAGCIYLADKTKRANEGAEPIPQGIYRPREALPEGDKIVVRGSTSMEKLIMQTAAGYAATYGVKGNELFDIQLQGSSVGKEAVKGDEKGNVVGLSSASVCEEGVESFNVCLDAVVVLVNEANTIVNDLSLKQLYDIFSGRITKFSELE